MGDADPLPWWLNYVNIALELNKWPWEMFDYWTPRSFWVACIAMVFDARSIAASKTAPDHSSAVPS